jgi:hypothetical protein
MELEGIFKDNTLRQHNQKTYDFFVAFKPEQIVGNKFDKVFKVVAAIEKKKTTPATKSTSSDKEEK